MKKIDKLTKHFEFSDRFIFSLYQVVRFNQETRKNHHHGDYWSIGIRLVHLVRRIRKINQTMADTQQHRRSASLPRARSSRAKSTAYDRTPSNSRMIVTSQTAMLHRQRSSSSQSRRRSSSAKRHPPFHPHTHSQHHPQHYQHEHRHLPPHRRPEGSDVGSVGSSTSFRSLHKEYRQETSSIKSGGSKSKRDDPKSKRDDSSPANSKKSQSGISQKHTKTARKVIEGKRRGRIVLLMIRPH